MKKFQILGQILNKNQMKKIVGGTEDAGTRCVVYCCDNNNNCGEGTQLSGVTSCSSNEGCQTIAIEGGASCPSGYYVAALCKG